MHFLVSFSDSEGEDRGAQSDAGGVLPSPVAQTLSPLIQNTNTQNTNMAPHDTDGEHSEDVNTNCESVEESPDKSNPLAYDFGDPQSSSNSPNMAPQGSHDKCNKDGDSHSSWPEKPNKPDQSDKVGQPSTTTVQRGSDTAQGGQHPNSSQEEAHNSENIQQETDTQTVIMDHKGLPNQMTGKSEKMPGEMTGANDKEMVDVSGQ